MKLKLSEIIIKPSFENSTPSEIKLEICKDNYRNGIINKQIIVNHKNELVDGYILYLVLKENEVEETPIVIQRYSKEAHKQKKLNQMIKSQNVKTYWDTLTTYVWGKHNKHEDSKEYVWRLANKNGSTNCNLRIGDRILVNTKNGRSYITVTRIEELDERPIEKAVKKCYSRR